MKNIILIILSSTLLFISCGGEGSNGSPAPEVNALKPEAIIIPGHFKGFLRPMNTHISGFVTSGVADVSVTQKEVKVNIIMDDAAGVSHLQTLHYGSKCPTLEDDLNGDSYIDSEEAKIATGEIHFPLDRDISSPEKGANTFPFGKSYTYKETALIQEMRVNKMENIEFKNRVVLIYGAPSTANLPGSVSRVNDKTTHASLPIACGILKEFK